jgi:hypothetical protein
MLSGYLLEGEKATYEELRPRYDRGLILEPRNLSAELHYWSKVMLGLRIPLL